MERDVALRIDGMLISINGELNGVAHYMKNNLTQEEFSGLIKHIGQAMGALYYFSSALHSEFPDIVPKELRPPTAPEK